MGWRGAIRSFQAAARAAERDARRQQRDLQRRVKERARMEALAEAEYEVAVYENQIELLTSIHKDCSPAMDWQAVLASPEPEAPSPPTAAADAARLALEQYKPGIFAKLFGSAAKRRQQLEEAIPEAKRRDQEEADRLAREHAEEVETWRRERDLAGRVLAGDPTAYAEAMRLLEPFQEFSGLGAQLALESPDGRPDCMTVELTVAEKSAVPAEIKSLTKTGKLSTRAMPKGRSNELYQDYVCGAALRVARELFALLPLNIVVITVMTELLDSKTGHMRSAPVLSAIMPRTTIAKLDFSTLDPSDSMANFLHEAKFKKTTGFAPVRAFGVADIPGPNVASEPYR